MQLETVKEKREQTLAKIRERQDKRRQLAIEWKSKMRSHSQQDERRPLYLRLQEEYTIKVQESELEKRKKALQEIRNLKKPLNRDEFDEHVKRYEEELGKRTELLNQHRQERIE